MNFGDLVLNASIALISGYLALSTMVSTALENSLIQLGLLSPQEISQTIVVEEEKEVTTPSPLTQLPSRYELGGTIPKILLENSEYQAAAIAGIGTGKDKKDTAHPVDAIVNVFCKHTEGDRTRATTGSGVFIDDRGIILTNAHVAQFLLLSQGRTDAKCVIRQGTPAHEKYTADLLYIPPTWIFENANLIDAKEPTGTGERDYALLFVTSAITGELPTTFPALTFETSYLTQRSIGDTVLAGGYPAAIFKTEGPKADLMPKIATTTITQLYTFGSERADLMAIGNSEVGEQGVSGGPVLNENNTILGLIVTRGNAEDGEKSLRAITLPYINATIKEETGFDLENTLTGNIERRSTIFKGAIVSFLSGLLEKELN